MNQLKLTVLSLLTVAFFITACTKDGPEGFYSNTNIAMTGAQEVPANSSAAIGKASVNYDRSTGYLNYTVEWSGLTDTLTGMHIHGPADPGFSAGILHRIIDPTSFSVSNGATIANTGKAYIKSGNISARVFIDGFVLKEADLLAGKYYFNIHSKAFTNGEIRGQITF